jgi:protein ImuB
MPRVVSIFLPTWPTDCWRRKRGSPPPEAPFALVGPEGNRNVVTAADLSARSLGIRIGMPATQAQALVAELVVQEADPVGDSASLDRLAVWALRYSPVAAADPPDGLVLDTTGADHLHGGEEAMLADIAGRLAAAGARARLAISDTWGASYALARVFSDERGVVPTGRTAEVLAGVICHSACKFERRLTSRAFSTQPALKFSRQSPARTASLSLRRHSATRIRR